MVNIDFGVSGVSGFATCHTDMTPPFACEIVSVNSRPADATSVFGKLQLTLQKHEPPYSTQTCVCVCVLVAAPGLSDLVGGPDVARRRE